MRFLKASLSTQLNEKYSLLPLGASFCSLYVFFSFEGIPIAFPGVVTADFLHTEIVTGTSGEEPLSMVVEINFFSPADHC